MFCARRGKGVPPNQLSLLHSLGRVRQAHHGLVSTFLVTSSTVQSDWCTPSVKSVRRSARELESRKTGHRSIFCSASRMYRASLAASILSAMHGGRTRIRTRGSVPLSYIENRLQHDSELIQCSMRLGTGHSSRREARTMRKEAAIVAIRLPITRGQVDGAARPALSGLSKTPRSCEHSDSSVWLKSNETLHVACHSGSSSLASTGALKEDDA